MEYLADTPSGDPMHYAFEEIGAVWNEESRLWSYNKLNDITNRQMVLVYNQTDFDFGASTLTSNNRRYQGCPARTNRTKKYNANTDIGIGSCSSTFYFSSLEVINLEFKSNGNTLIESASYMFAGSSKLKTIIGKLRIKNMSNTFNGCRALENINIKELSENLNLNDCSNITNETIIYAIENEMASSKITITLHPTAYARAIADAGVQAALAAHPNVSLASA